MKQLTLGELIDKLEQFTHLRNSEDKERYVAFDFGTAIPTTIASWRGVYAQPALGYKLTGYDSDKGHMDEMTISALLANLKEALTKSFEGWKGGEFCYREDSTLWVANSGNSGNTGVVDVTDDGYYHVIIHTAYFES